MTAVECLSPELAAAAAHPATAHARAMLTELGIPCDGEETGDTPARLVRALLELTAGLRRDPDRHLARTFPPPGADPGMVVVTGVPFISVCEHHLLAFTGTATVGYLPVPGARIVGLSKLARLVCEYAARPQVQERLGDQVTSALTRCLDTLGAGCVLRAEHSCMSLRGVRATGAVMVTSHLTGRLRDDPAARGEFLHLAGAAG